MKNYTYYFLPHTEYELLLMAGLSEIIKRAVGGKTILILVNHPRLKNKMYEYFNHFDEILKLPFCDYRQNFIQGYKDLFEVCMKTRKIHFAVNRIIFCCSGKELISIVILYYFLKRRNCDNVIFTNIFPYPDEKTNMHINIINSIITSIYGLLLGRKILYVSEKGYPGYYDYLVKPYSDIIINIEHERKYDFVPIYENVPSPLEFVDTSKVNTSKCDDLVDPGVIIFADNRVPIVYRISEKDYWQFIKLICDYLKTKHNLIVYIKLHPTSSEDILKKNKIDALLLDKKVVSEEYFLFKREKILGIFSTASTSLLSGSLMGIPSFNFSNLVGIKGIIRDRLMIYLKPGKNIRHLTSIHELDGEVFLTQKLNDEKRHEKEIGWQKIIEEISK